MLLAHEILGEGPRLMALTHGILGSGHNLRGLARRLVERLPGWRALTLDLRNHGESRGAAPPHTVETCAGDLIETFARLGAPAAVLGHSYGAKVALAWAARAPKPPRQVWLLDAPIGPRDRGSDTDGAREIEAVLAALASLPLPIASRAALVELLRARSLPEPICQWMTTNLRQEGAGFVWRFDLPAIAAMVESFWQSDLWPAVASLAPTTAIHLVRAGRGGRFSDAERARVDQAAARGLVEELVIPHVGHWLHTEDPEALLTLVVPRLAALDHGARP